MPQTTGMWFIGLRQPAWAPYRKIYYTTTTDFNTFTTPGSATPDVPGILYDPGFPVIDANIVKDEATGNYVMFVKDERDGIVYKAQGGPNLIGAYDTSATPKITTIGCEAPNAIKISGTWYVYPDFYSQMGLVTSSDGINWTTRNNEIVFPANGKHGSVFTVPRSVADNLIANASLPTTEIEFDGHAGTSDFHTAGNWLGNAVPTTSQIPVIQHDQTVTLTSSPSGTLAGLKVGQSTSGTLNISGNTTLNVSGNVNIGRLNAVGTINISGGSLERNRHHSSRQRRSASQRRHDFHALGQWQRQHGRFPL